MIQSRRSLLAGLVAVVAGVALPCRAEAVLAGLAAVSLGGVLPAVSAATRPTITVYKVPT